LEALRLRSRIARRPALDVANELAATILPGNLRSAIRPLVLPLPPAPSTTLRLSHPVRYVVRGILRVLTHMATHLGWRWRTLVHLHVGHILL
jgi:hypothetical protein